MGKKTTKKPITKNPKPKPKPTSKKPRWGEEI